MGRTLTQLRQDVVRALQYPVIAAMADASGGSASLLVDLDILSHYADDELIGLWVYDLDATAADYLITDSDSSAGSMTLRPSRSSGDFNSNSYEVLPFSARAIKQAIEDAILHLYDVGLLVRSFTIGGVTGSPLYNSQFDYWTSSTALHGWTATTLTATRSQTTKWVGENTATLSGSAGNLRPDTVWRRFLSDFADQNVRVYLWCQTSVASNIRVQIVGASNTYSSSYHSGDGGWELLEAEGKLDIADLDWIPSIDFAGGGNASVPPIWVEGYSTSIQHPLPVPLCPDGPSAIYLSPMDLAKSSLKAAVRPTHRASYPDFVWNRYHDQQLDSQVGTVLWTRTPSAGLRVMFEVAGPLSLPSADSTVVEVNQYEGLLLAKVAAMRLLEGEFMKAAGQRRVNLAERVNRLQREIEALSEGVGAQANSAQLPRLFH